MKKLNKSFLMIFFLPLFLVADNFDSSNSVIQKTNDKLSSYQKRIDASENKREILLDEYKYTNLELKNTKTYNNQLQKIISSQNSEIFSLQKQIKEIEETQKNIVPLMIKMTKSLESLIELDTPFLLKERKQRVQRIKNALDRADIKIPEKYRIILEAFKIEYDYAKTIESYQDDINGRTFNILRIGRVGLYYQSLDLKDYGYWNNKTKRWVKIDKMSSKMNISKGIKIAKKEANAGFLNLPFLTKKD